MVKRTYKPKEHTLYWVYGYDKGENNYDFDTTTRIDAARRIARELIRDDIGLHHVYIFYGDEDGAFTHLDPADQHWPFGEE